VNPVWARIAFQTAHMSHTQWEAMRAAVKKGDYEDAQPFTEGLAAVSWNQKWGYINTSGKLLIPMQYEQESDFRGGYAAVYPYKSRGSAFIDKNGMQVFAQYWAGGGSRKGWRRSRLRLRLIKSRLRTALV